MTRYQLYFFDARRRPAGCFEFSSADDEQAQRAARQFGSERGGELWCGERRVEIWTSDLVASA